MGGMFTYGTFGTAEHPEHPWAGAGRCGCPLVCHGETDGNGSGWPMAAIPWRSRAMVAGGMGAPYGAIGGVLANRSQCERPL